MALGRRHFIALDATSSVIATVLLQDSANRIWCGAIDGLYPLDRVFTFWQFDLGFDSTLLMATSVSEGPFMWSLGATSFVPGVIDNTTGVISLVSDAYVDFHRIRPAAECSP